MAAICLGLDVLSDASSADTVMTKMESNIYMGIQHLKAKG